MSLVNTEHSPNTIQNRNICLNYLYKKVSNIGIVKILSIKIKVTKNTHYVILLCKYLETYIRKTPAQIIMRLKHVA